MLYRVAFKNDKLFLIILINVFCSQFFPENVLLILSHALTWLFFFIFIHPPHLPYNITAML